MSNPPVAIPEPVARPGGSGPEAWAPGHWAQGRATGVGIATGGLDIYFSIRMSDPPVAIPKPRPQGPGLLMAPVSGLWDCYRWVRHTYREIDVEPTRSNPSSSNSSDGGGGDDAAISPLPRLPPPPSLPPMELL